MYDVKLVAVRHYAVTLKQLSNSNDRNMVRWEVLGSLQDRACTDLFENFSENCLKGDLSNDTFVNPPLSSLVNTFKGDFFWIDTEERLWDFRANLKCEDQRINIRRTVHLTQFKAFSWSIIYGLFPQDIRIFWWTKFIAAKQKCTHCYICHEFWKQ